MYLRLNIYLLSCLILLVSCKQTNADISNLPRTGKYSHIHFSFLKKAYLYINGIRHLPVSDTLIINSDKTFEIKYCNGNNSGNWEIINDTLRIVYYNKETLIQKDYKVNKNKLIQIYQDKSWYSEYQLDN